MAPKPKPIEILKKGLKKFKSSIKKRVDELNNKLSRQESISSLEEKWLDNEANTIDEQRIVDIDITTPPKPLPTRRDILKAISTIGRYTDEWNDPFARKMEGMMALLARQLRVDEERNMRNTVLTDYFQRR